MDKSELQEARIQILIWLQRICFECQFSRATYWTSMEMFDRALLTKMYKIGDLQDVGVLCLNASLNLNESNRKVTLEQLC
jgi:hypothetical protein